MTQTVTIAIPTYNRADRFLRSAIECALAQTWHDLEIIVSDNCSSDNTAEVVQSYSDPRLRYVRQERNIGANNNFNYCLEQANGVYFLLLPDDDLIDEDMVSVCMEAAGGNTDYGLIRTGSRLLDGDGTVIREIPNRAAGLSYIDFFRGWMHGSFTSYVCSTLFNTRLLREIGGLQSRHGLFQDMMAIARLIARAGHCDVEEVKAGFRRHEANYGTVAELRAWCEDGRQLAETIASEAPEDGEELYRESMRYLCLTVYRYAKRFLPGRLERFRAYRMIEEEFGHFYPVKSFVFDQVFTRRYRILKSKARRVAKKFVGDFLKHQPH